MVPWLEQLVANLPIVGLNLDLACVGGICFPSVDVRHGVNSILSIPIPLYPIWSIPVPNQIDKFQF